MTKNFISKTQAAKDQQMREALNNKYKKQVNELLHWDINVIGWEIIITKWWWSNNRIVFPDESQLKMFLDGVEWQVLISQWQQYQEDLKAVINKCNHRIKLVKQNPEYFSDDFDEDMISWFQFIKDTLSKYIN